MAYATVVKVCQLVNSLHATVFFRMIEPTRTDRHVTLCSNPLVTVCMTILQFTILSITREHFASTEKRPVSCTGKTVFITYPTAARTTIREDNCLRLEFIQHFINLRIVIVVLAVDCSAILSTTVPTITTIRTVEPNFKHFAIASHQLTKLLVEVFYIFRRSIVSLMSVPWRKIYRKLDSVLLTSCRQFAYDVTLTIFIRRVTDTVLCQLCRPQTETIVVLGCKDYALHAGIYECLYPLFAIQLSRIEGSRI